MRFNFYYCRNWPGHQLHLCKAEIGKINCYSQGTQLKLKPPLLGLYMNQISSLCLRRWLEKVDGSGKIVAQIKNVKEFVNKTVSESTGDPQLLIITFPHHHLVYKNSTNNQVVSTHPGVLSLGKYLLLRSCSLLKERINFAF